MDFGIKPTLHRVPGQALSKQTATAEDARAFLFAAALRDFAKIRHLIEIKGLHPDTTTSGKPTAVCYAVLKQDNCLLSYLLKRGASVNIADRIGMTPLHYAALGGSPWCIAYLVRYGARLDARSHSGETPYTLIRNRPDLAECVELLGRYGGRVAHDGNSQTRFH